LQSFPQYFYFYCCKSDNKHQMSQHAHTYKLLWNELFTKSDVRHLKARRCSQSDWLAFHSICSRYV